MLPDSSSSEAFFFVAFSAATIFVKHTLRRAARKQSSVKGLTLAHSSTACSGTTRVSIHETGTLCERRQLGLQACRAFLVATHCCVLSYRCRARVHQLASRLRSERFGYSTRLALYPVLYGDAVTEKPYRNPQIPVIENSKCHGLNVTLARNVLAVTSKARGVCRIARCDS